MSRIELPWQELLRPRLGLDAHQDPKAGDHDEHGVGVQHRRHLAGVPLVHHGAGQGVRGGHHPGDRPLRRLHRGGHRHLPQRPGAPPVEPRPGRRRGVGGRHQEAATDSG